MNDRLPAWKRPAEGESRWPVAVAIVVAAAFSPTDTMPLSRWAKLAMMVQASISVIIVALVIARAVNILS